MEEGRSFLSVRQAAKVSSLSTRFLYDACQKRQLKFYKCGRRIVIEHQDLVIFLTQEPVEPVDWDGKARELIR